MAKQDKNKVKKPIYKKWWFWLIIVIIVGGALGSGGEDEATPETDVPEVEDVAEAEEVEAVEEDPEENIQDEATEEEEAEESVLLQVGDSYTIDDITMTVTGYEFTDERNQFAEVDPERVIGIQFEIANDTDSDYPFGMDFDVYVDGRKASTYPLGTDIGSVSAGRTVEGTTYYGIDGESIEVEWEPLFSFSGDKGIWEIVE